MAFFAENNLPRYNAEDLPGTVRKLYSFCQELQETLLFVLANLDEDNIPEMKGLLNEVYGADGAFSKIKQTAEEILMQVGIGNDRLAELSIKADGITAQVYDASVGIGKLEIRADRITAQVADNESNMAKLNITAKEISSQVVSAQGDLSRLQQTADSISTQVSNTQGDLSRLQQRADGITAQVTDAEGNISYLQQTAKSLTTRVSNAEGDISTLNQTAGSLSTQITNINGDLSSLNQTARGLESRVSSAEGSISTVSQTANGLKSTVSDLSGKYSSLQQTVDGFDFDGLVTFRDLERRGSTEINGDNITTGTISLERLELDNEYGYIEMGEGSTGHYDTEGIVMAGPRARNMSGGLAPSRYRNFFFASDSGARMTGEDAFGSESIYVCADDIDASIAPGNWSDERLKKDISYDVGARYGAFFRALRPARFRMRSSRSGRYHTGFIAQQVRDALEACGLTRQDLAALVQKDYNPQAGDGGGGRYSIRYGELTALNTAMIQGLLARVDALEARISKEQGG